jgi:carboxypeptidase C (cathepsin A)
MRLCALLLLATRFAVHALSPEAFAVKDLEAVAPAFGKFDGDMFAGLLPISRTSGTEQKSADDVPEGGALFFWLFEPNEPTDDDSVVIWINGGPGCTSMAGNLVENGPITTPQFPAGTFHSSDWNPAFAPNEHAWTKATTMLYVEQPAGVGFSFGPTVSNEADLSSNFHNWLQNFYEVFQKLRPKRLFIFGESYAGMYVPSIAHEIHTQKASDAAQGMPINLAGIGIGNGWIDVEVQVRRKTMGY